LRLPYLQPIDEARWYANRGDLGCEHERRLSSALGHGTGRVGFTTNSWVRQVGFVGKKKL
jgi:hypothetical protein